MQVIGISIDHVPCLQAWAESLGGINFPLLSDFWPHGSVAERYGVLRSEGHSERAIFIIDANGFIRYIDIHDIDDQPSNDVLFAELERIVPQDVQREAQKPKSSQPAAELPTSGVVMYCNSWCPDCRRARTWFKSHEIEFTEVDVMESREASRQVREWANGNLVTPTFNINGKVIIDFKIKELEEALGIHTP